MKNKPYKRGGRIARRPQRALRIGDEMKTKQMALKDISREGRNYLHEEYLVLRYTSLKENLVQWP